MITERNNYSSLSAMQPTIDSSQTLLNDLETSSKVGRLRIFFWIVATCAYTVELMVDLAVLALEALSRKSRFGTLPWYVNQSLLFQYGDSLVYQNGEYQYLANNQANQIIKRAAAQENGNTINVKVAKLVANSPAPLSPGEKAAFEAYFERIKPAGSDVAVISDPPDELRIYLKAKYDPLVLDANGQLIGSPGTYPLEVAVNGYISNLNVSNFNGILELSDLVDAVQKAQAITNPYVTHASARYGTNPFVAFTERYQANAGHLTIDPTTPLNITTTYQPQNV